MSNAAASPRMVSSGRAGDDPCAKSEQNRCDFRYSLWKAVDPLANALEDRSRPGPPRASARGLDRRRVHALLPSRRGCRGRAVRPPLLQGQRVGGGLRKRAIARHPISVPGRFVPRRAAHGRRGPVTRHATRARKVFGSVASRRGGPHGPSRGTSPGNRSQSSGRRSAPRLRPQGTSPYRRPSLLDPAFTRRRTGRSLLNPVERFRFGRTPSLHLPPSAFFRRFPRWSVPGAATCEW